MHSLRLDHGETTITALRDFIYQHNIGMVVLDTLSRYWNVRDENDNAGVVREVSPFLDLAHETGCTVVLVHHESKSGGENGRGIRGASSLLALAFVAIASTSACGNGGAHCSSFSASKAARIAVAQSPLACKLRATRYK